MSPELTKLLENFNLDNYANLEKLTLADWYTQFQFRAMVGTYELPFSKAIPELLKCPLRPVGGFTNLEYDPDDRLMGVEEVSIWRMKSIVEDAETAKEINLTEPPIAEQTLIFQINDEVDDGQIKSDFNQLLKERRKATGKFSHTVQIEHWIDFKILQFIDICLIAMSIDHPDDRPYMRSPLFKMNNVDKHITHQEIAYILFKDDIEENPKLIDAQRIKTCFKTVRKTIQPNYLRMLGCRAADMGETHSIKGLDSLVSEYGFEQVNNYLQGKIDFVDKDDKDSAYLIDTWKKYCLFRSK